MSRSEGRWPDGKQTGRFEKGSLFKVPDWKQRAYLGGRLSTVASRRSRSFSRFDIEPCAPLVDANPYSARTNLCIEKETLLSRIGELSGYGGEAKRKKKKRE